MQIKRRAFIEMCALIVANPLLSVHTKWMSVVFPWMTDTEPQITESVASFPIVFPFVFEERAVCKNGRPTAVHVVMTRRMFLPFLRWFGLK